MPVRRESAVESGDVAPGYAAFCSDLKATWGDLHDWLTMQCDDRGVKRSTSSMTVFVDEGLFKVVLNDKDTGRSLWVSNKTLWGALDALEAHLVAGTGEWRRNRKEGGRQR